MPKEFGLFEAQLLNMVLSDLDDADTEICRIKSRFTDLEKHLPVKVFTDAKVKFENIEDRISRLSIELEGVLESEGFNRFP